MTDRLILEDVNRATSIKIVNLVMTADLRQGVELVKIGELPYVSYDPAKYNGRVAYLTLPGMSGKVTIFQSGKLISVGTRSGAQAKRDLTFVVKYLASKQIIKPISLEPKIRNIVAAVDLGESLDIEALYSHIGSIVYEPEVFPAAIYKPDCSPGATVLLFSSGKAIISGVTTLKEIDDTISELRNRIARFEE